MFLKRLFSNTFDIIVNYIVILIQKQHNKKMKTKALTQKGQYTKKKIIDLAMAMIRAKGFDETTIRDICENAEVGLGTFYHYFHSKEEVLLAYIEEENDELINYYSRLEKTSYGTAILAVIHHYLDMYFFKGAGLVSHIYTMLFYSGIDNKLIEKNAFARIVREAYIAGQRNGEFQKQIPVDTFCNLAIGGWFYLTSLWCNSPGTFNIREEIDRLYTQLIEMITKPE